MAVPTLVQADLGQGKLREQGNIVVTLGFYVCEGNDEADCKFIEESKIDDLEINKQEEGRTYRR